MWEITGNTKIKEFARDIIEISTELRVIEHDLKVLNEDIDVYNKRINIYLSNVFNKPNFKHGEHVIAIKEEFNISVYTKKSVADNGNSVKNIEPVFTYKSNKKQIAKIVDILHDYNGYVDDFEELIEEYEMTANNHKEMWKEVKVSLKGLTFLKLQEKPKKTKTIDLNETKDIQEFDEEKHLLVIVMDGENDWNFRYIRKEDEEKFNKFLEKEMNKVTEEE
jgi:hypothetical protein